MGDLALIDEPAGVKPFALKKLRDTHHFLARLVAEGRTGAEIGSLTGYSQSRISILKSDPAFADLVSYYKKHLEELRDQFYTDFHQKMSALRDDSVEELHDRVLDTPEVMSSDQILDIVKVTADRTGFGPSTKSTNVNYNLNLAAQRAEGRQRAERLSAGPSPETPDQQSLPPADRGEAQHNG